MDDKETKSGRTDKVGAQTHKDEQASSRRPGTSAQDECGSDVDSFAGGSTTPEGALAFPERPVVSSMASQGFFAI